ncbi:MAG: hypothetical protein LW870_17385 [Pirellula sp.]|nr:hypothetical protein [Pirellula sp.]
MFIPLKREATGNRSPYGVKVCRSHPNPKRERGMARPSLTLRVGMDLLPATDALKHKTLLSRLRN